jgi:hypothetical protein
MLQTFLSHIHTYHPRFIPKGVAEASQIFLRDAHVLPNRLGMRNTVHMQVSPLLSDRTLSQVSVLLVF